jgi:protein FrlC
MKYAQSSAVYYYYSLQYAIDDLHRLGYDGVEIWGGRPHMYRRDLEEQMDGIVSHIRGRGLAVCNFIPAQFRYPSLLCSENETVRKESVEYIQSAIDNAVKVGSPSVSLCPGMAAFDGDVKKARTQLVKSFREILEYAQDLGLSLLIEPAHRFESNLILTIDDCMRMIDELKSDRFGVLLDTGHCHVNGEDFRKIVPKCRGVPLHVHVDDNRGDTDAHLIPGAGTVVFEALAESLRTIGYSGFLSAELGTAYIMDPTAACRDTLAFFKSVFE